MLAEKVNYGIERATIIALCLWGNWAIYYWVAVLVFDASYISLKAYIPVLAMQIVISLLYLLRTDLGFLNVNSRTSAFVKLSPRHITGTSFLMLAVSPTLLAVIVVFAADHFQWTNSALSYNLFWALMLPCSLAYLLYPKVFNGDSPAPAVDEGDRSSTLDCLLFLFGVSALAITVYGLGFPAWDEAFYGHVMSSMLANPALPVQGQDLLLDTSAPYSLHPSYRGVGYEVLIAWISDVMGLNPLQLYFDIFPVCGAILWSFAAYLFMRAVRVPYPGLAVTVSFLILLIWGGQGFSVGFCGVYMAGEKSGSPDSGPAFVFLGCRIHPTANVSHLVFATTFRLYCGDTFVYGPVRRSFNRRHGRYRFSSIDTTQSTNAIYDFPLTCANILIAGIRIAGAPDGACVQ